MWVLSIGIADHFFDLDLLWRGLGAAAKAAHRTRGLRIYAALEFPTTEPAAFPVHPVRASVRVSVRVSLQHSQYSQGHWQHQTQVSRGQHSRLPLVHEAMPKQSRPSFLWHQSTIGLGQRHHGVVHHDSPVWLSRQHNKFATLRFRQTRETFVKYARRQ